MAWFPRGPRLVGVTAATLVRVSARDHRCNATGTLTGPGIAADPGIPFVPFNRRLPVTAEATTFL